MLELLPAQRVPKEPWDVWIILGGRGAGKSQAAAAYVADNAHSPIISGASHALNTYLAELVVKSFGGPIQGASYRVHRELLEGSDRGVTGATVWLDEPFLAGDNTEALVHEALRLIRDNGRLVITAAWQESYPTWFIKFMTGSRVKVTLLGNAKMSEYAKQLARLQLPTDMLGMVREFHEKFELRYDGPPRQLPGDMGKFRRDFMLEEIDEHFNAEYDSDLEKQLDALVDLAYVLFGTAYLQGFTPEKFYEAFRRVHAANMLKVRALKAEDSKRGSTYDVVKPEGWQPPDLSDLVV